MEYIVRRRNTPFLAAQMTVLDGMEIKHYEIVPKQWERMTHRHVGPLFGFHRRYSIPGLVRHRLDDTLITSEGTHTEGWTPVGSNGGGIVLAIGGNSRISVSQAGTTSDQWKFRGAESRGHQIRMALHLKVLFKPMTTSEQRCKSTSGNTSGFLRPCSS
jgi:hypothetical protein